uniref:Pheophorbide a oxygenase domain-containing protein n=1 Tax=Chenopodium quinoa TaxID=63459 RepID=A0A803MGQ3_CHEQI
VTGRRDRAKPLPFKVESSGPWGFAGANDDNPKISAEFISPCYYMNKIETDAKLPIVVPRWHEHWTSNKVYDGDMIVLQGQEKYFHSKTTDDSEDINAQYTKITFTPTQSDRFVLAFRNWLRRHGDGQPEWFGDVKQQPLPSTVLSKRQEGNYNEAAAVCETWQQHYF